MHSSRAAATVFYPAKAELVLDVIPVDLAAHGDDSDLGALLSRKQKPIYQLCTSDLEFAADAPTYWQRALSNRREHRNNGWTHALARTASGSGRGVAEASTTCPSEKLPKLLKQAAAFARSVVGEENQRAKKVESEIAKFKENTDLARELVEVYRPYIQELVYTFHASKH